MSQTHARSSTAPAATLATGALPSTTAMAPITLKLLSADGQRALEDVQDEWKELLERRPTSSLDASLMVSRHDRLAQHLTPASVEVDAPDEISGLREGFRIAHGTLLLAMQRKPLGLHGAARYSKQAHGLKAEAKEAFVTTRKRASLRLTGPAHTSLRAKLGVHADINMKSPLSLSLGLAAQAEALADPDNFATLRKAGVNPARSAQRIEAILPRLRAAIVAGTLDEPTKAEVNEAIARALVNLEVVLSRAVVWLEDWVGPAAAKALEEDVPTRKTGGVKKARGEPELAPVAVPTAPVPESPAAIPGLVTSGE